MSENIISFRTLTKWDKIDQNTCRHLTVIVDEELWSIECQTCGAKLDPIQFLIRLGQQEKDVEYRIDRLKKIEADIQGRVRTKCEHCGKLTRISHGVSPL